MKRDTPSPSRLSPRQLSPRHGAGGVQFAGSAAPTSDSGSSDTDANALEAPRAFSRYRTNTLDELWLERILREFPEKPVKDMDMLQEWHEKLQERENLLAEERFDYDPEQFESSPSMGRVPTMGSSAPGLEWMESEIGDGEVVLEHVEPEDAFRFFTGKRYIGRQDSRVISATVQDDGFESYENRMTRLRKEIPEVAALVVSEERRPHHSLITMSE
eukprot:GHVU01225501.1.p1 GENE.GHVU01225501.1~~GHVU01225501.1.p1  ORF type:complete len:216 (+),score=38.32 GHVU01225501.1:101-748(+)